MELNVIDISKDGEQRRQRMSAKRASGEDISLWPETAAGGKPVRSAASQSKPIRRVQQQAPSGRSRGDSRPRSRAETVPRPARPREPEIYGGESVRRPRPGRPREPESYRGESVRRPRPARPREPESYRREPVRRPRPAEAGTREARARQERLRRKKRRQRKQMAARLTVLLFLVGVIVLSATLLIRLVTGEEKPVQTVQNFQEIPQDADISKVEENNGKPFMTEDFLPVNDYSRPGEALEAVNNIFVHYTANRGTSAAQNRSYFENLATTGETSASAHFIIGYDGEIIQCIPLDEIGYAVMGRNYDSISIECCYLQEDGKFTDETYQSLIRLCAWLLKEYQLAPQDMRRHYDEGGKKCPLYFTEHVEDWEKFKQDLGQFMQGQNSI